MFDFSVFVTKKYFVPTGLFIIQYCFHYHYFVPTGQFLENKLK